jgi:hypothetical protein
VEGRTPELAEAAPFESAPGTGRPLGGEARRGRSTRGAPLARTVATDDGAAGSRSATNAASSGSTAAKAPKVVIGPWWTRHADRPSISLDEPVGNVTTAYATGPIPPQASASPEATAAVVVRVDLADALLAPDRSTTIPTHR